MVQGNFDIDLRECDCYAKLNNIHCGGNDGEK